MALRGSTGGLCSLQALSPVDAKEVAIASVDSFFL